MAKNIVYISALDGFADDFSWGIDTWESYCRKHNLRLIVSTERDPVISKSINGSWYPWFDPKLCWGDWDRAIIVDADTMVRWSTPNLFDVEQSSFAVVKDSSPLDYGAIPHLDQWRKDFDVTMPPENYFNAGFILLDREKYQTISSKIKPYHEYASKPNVGTSSWEQTPVNLLAWDNFSADIKYLPKIWNDMLGFNYEYGDMSFINMSFVMHFTGPNLQSNKEKRKQIMKDTYMKIYHNYES